MYLDHLSNAAWQQTNPGGNYSTNGYPTRNPTQLVPNLVTSGVTSAGDGVIPLGYGGSICPYHVILIPYGVGADDTTFSLTVLGWRPTTGNFGATLTQPLWVPVTIAVYQATLGTASGVAGSDLPSTQKFADAITVTSGPSFINSAAPNTIPPVSLDWLVISAAADSIGMIVQPTFGFQFLEVIFTTGGSATSCNALYCKA